MKPYLIYTHEGKTAISDAKTFCRLKGFEYLGAMFSKDTFESMNGAVVKVNGAHYVVTGLGSSPANEGIVKSTLSLRLVEDFNPANFISKDECKIIISVWCIDVDDEAPICTLGFEKGKLQEAQKTIQNESDVDIWIDSEKVDKETFMAMTECP